MRTLACVVLAALVLSRATADGADPPPVEMRLPFPAEVSWPVLQGNDQGPSHNDDANRHAFDFGPMPIGSPVCAAADGVVERVKEDMDGPSTSTSDRDDNAVVLLHADGLRSAYLHLQKDGALVEVGDKVLAGDVIALSGETGKTTSPHLHFALLAPGATPKTAPCKFVNVEGDGVPKTGQTVKSGNVAVRAVPGCRETRLAIDLLRLCREIAATGVALPYMENARKSPPKLKHPSVDALLAERDLAAEEHRVLASDEGIRLRTAKEEKNLDTIAQLATFGPADWADVPAFAKELKGLAAAWAKEPGWADALARLDQRTEYRKLVADAVKEEVAATSRFIVPKKFDPKAKPDFSAAVLAWTRARAKAPDLDMASAIRRHADALAKASR